MALPTTTYVAVLETAGADPPVDNNHTQVAAPGTLRVKGVASTGVAVCFLDPSFPAPCSPTPGAPSGVGGAIFNVSNDSDYGANSVVYGTAWAAYNLTASPTDLFPLIGGFSITVCTDRDDDGSCLGGADQFVTEYSNEELNCDPENNTCPKDKKNETSPYEAGAFFCFEKDLDLGGGDWDEIIVFVGAWADENVLFANPKDGLGAGVSAGVYDVYLDMAPQHASDRSECLPTYQGEGEPDEPNFCSIQRTVIAGRPGVPGRDDVQIEGCAGAVCNAVPAPGPLVLGGAPNPVPIAAANQVVTVTCTVKNACEEVPAAVIAALFNGNDATADVRTTLICVGDAPIASATAKGPAPPLVIETDTGDKTDGDYVCTVRFDAGFGHPFNDYLAVGICLDEDQLDRTLEQLRRLGESYRYEAFSFVP